MKQSILILLWSLSLQVTAQENGVRKVEGSGNIVSEERALNNFTGIQSEGSFDLVITQENNQKLVVKTDDNIMPFVKTEVSSGKLRIYFSERFHYYQPTSLKVYISAALIEKLHILGSGTAQATNQIKAKKLQYSVTGSGKISLSVLAENIETTITGSGTIDLEGSATSAKHNISGSGNLNALPLASADVKASISGSGNCLVNAETALDASIRGGGRILYKGTPHVTSHVMGSGKISRY